MYSSPRFNKEGETVKVKELIEKLQEMDQEAVVYFKSGYDAEYGEEYDEVTSVEGVIAWYTQKSKVFIE